MRINTQKKGLTLPGVEAGNNVVLDEQVIHSCSIFKHLGSIM